MKRHAVPQNIMSFEFKLFGGLTVRQFGYVSVTFLIALVIYFSGLPSIITYPMIIFTVMIGLAMALVTVNGMPFSTWFSNFVFNLFSSQRKVYHKTGNVPLVLSQQVKSPKPKPIAEKTSLDSRMISLLKNERPAFQDLETRATSIRNDEANLDDILEEKRIVELDRYFNSVAEQNLSKYNLKPAGDTLATAVRLPATTQALTEKQNVIEIKSAVPRPLGHSDLNVQKPVLAKSPGNVQPVPVEVQVTETAPPLPEIEVHSFLRPNQIAGFVVNADTAPVVNAQINVYDNGDNLLRTVYSDTKGKFIITSVLPDGSYRIEILANGLLFPEFRVELSGKQVPLYRYIAKSA